LSRQYEEIQMKVSEIMTREVETVTPDTTLQEAAKLMARVDAGALPILENDRLSGIITDRDIAVRAVGEGRDPATTKVRDIMSAQVRHVAEDDNVEQVADLMAELQVRRLPVVNRERRVVGIVSLGDIAREKKPRTAGEALQGISRPGGQHNS
jgi:CBS domain-containing protein